jgi:hypothetical protein
LVKLQENHIQLSLKKWDKNFKNTPYFREFLFYLGLRFKRRIKNMFPLYQGQLLVIAPLGQTWVNVGLRCVCVFSKVYETVDHLIWLCGRFETERHQLPDPFTVLDMYLGTSVRDFCAMKKWPAIKCCQEFFGGLGIKMWSLVCRLS